MVYISSEENNKTFSSHIIEIFYEDGCDACDTMDSEVFTVIFEKYGQLLNIKKFPINEDASFRRLSIYQQKFNINKNSPVSAVLNGKYFFSGLKELKNELPKKLDFEIQHGNKPLIHSNMNSPSSIEERYNQFSFVAVFTAGFLDGINPCAFTTLLFMVSLLFSLKSYSKAILLAGLGFILSSFVTYFLVGIGILEVLTFFKKFSSFALLFEKTMILVLLIFAFLSFKDAYSIYHKKINEVSLKLPRFIQKIIHYFLRSSTRSSFILIASSIAGVIVTLLETVCTGQVYLPTLAWMFRNSIEKVKSLKLLLLYNIGFILPAILLFIFSYKGLTMKKLILLSHKNSIIAKIGMGFFFLFMAILFFILN